MPPRRKGYRATLLSAPGRTAVRGAPGSASMSSCRMSLKHINIPFRLPTKNASLKNGLANLRVGFMELIS